MLDQGDGKLLSEDEVLHRVAMYRDRLDLSVTHVTIFLHGRPDFPDTHVLAGFMFHQMLDLFARIDDGITLEHSLQDSDAGAVLGLLALSSAQEFLHRFLVLR